jgi:hypothetical protein
MNSKTGPWGISGLFQRGRGRGDVAEGEVVDGGGGGEMGITRPVVFTR